VEEALGKHMRPKMKEARLRKTKPNKDMELNFNPTTTTNA
jgi:hypothetical protein